MEGKRILITGASGFIGMVLCQKLSPKNEIWALARFLDQDKKELLRQLNIKIIQKDIISDSISDLPTDFDVILHQLVILYEADINPIRTIEANTYFTGRLIKHCSRSKSIVLASTGGVYRASLNYEKEINPPGPSGWYSCSKLGMEYLGTYLSQEYKIPAIILRYFWPYGVEQGRVTRLMKSIKSGEPIKISKIQEDRYQPIYIDDLVDLTIRSLSLVQVNPPIYNIAGLDEFSWSELANQIGEEIGIKPIFQLSNEPRLSHLCDLSKMIANIGKPNINLKEGIYRVKMGLGY